MRLLSWITAGLALTVMGAPASAQDFAVKGGIAISRLEGASTTGFTDRLTSTSIGGHYRLRAGPVALQPEVAMVVRGGAFPDGSERLRLEYIELPLMLVVPVRVGIFEAYGFGGPFVALESRCRWITEEDGLKTNLGCEPQRIFERNLVDYGAAAGAGLSHPFLSGRILGEARYTWGMRDIHDGAAATIRNRSIVLSIGYAVDLSIEQNR